MENQENKKADSSRQEVQEPQKPKATDGSKTMPVTSGVQKQSVGGGIKPKTVSEIQKQDAAGPVAFDFGFENGMAKVTLTHNGTQGGVAVTGYVHTDNLLDKLEQAIPGDWDKAPIAALKMLVRNYTAEQARQEDEKKKEEQKKENEKKQEEEAKTSHLASDHVVQPEESRQDNLDARIEARKAELKAQHEEQNQESK